MRWLAHLLGIDNAGQTWPYNFWSGFAGQSTLLLGALGWFCKHNCHNRRCPRIGKHQVDGTPWCSRHRP